MAICVGCKRPIFDDSRRYRDREAGFQKILGLTPDDHVCDACIKKGKQRLFEEAIAKKAAEGYAKKKEAEEPNADIPTEEGNV